MTADADDWTHEDWERLRRYALGELTAPQARALEAWIAEDARRASVAESVLRHWAVALGVGKHTSARTKQEALREVLRRVSPGLSQRETERLSAGIRPTQSKWQSPSAVWALIRRSIRSESRFRHESSARFARVAGIAAAASVLAWIGYVALPALREPQHTGIFTTARGERSKITLPDGSRADLAPESRLVFVSTIGSDRQLKLVGQAYFTVAHDPRRKFVVHAGNAVLEDIGTRFLVSAYPADSAVRVVVTQGTVAIATAEGTGHRVLRSGMAGVVTTAAQISVAPVIDTALDLAWTSGQLLFQDTPLREVTAKLSRWYAIDIVIGDSALERVRIHGSLPASYRDDALTILASLARAKIVWRGTVATLVARSAPTAAIVRARRRS